MIASRMGPGPVRLQKYLSRAGVASRRDSEDLIEAGRVSIDGTVVTELGTKVVPGTQEVRVDGRVVELQAVRWVVLNKPPGYITARGDERGRPTVYQLLADELRSLFHVGRLDMDSEGLLIFTNEGDTAHRLLHPSYEIPRRYLVEVDGTPGDVEARRLEEGVMLQDGAARGEDVRIDRIDGDRSRIRLTVREGRKREVRRMMDALDLPVRRLSRVSFGPIRLGDLGPGEWRDLEPEEVRALRSVVDLGERDGDQ